MLPSPFSLTIQEITIDLECQMLAVTTLGRLRFSIENLVESEIEPLDAFFVNTGVVAFLTSCPEP